MVWAYAWLKVGYFPSPLAGILAVDDSSVRYTARSDDAKTRSATGGLDSSGAQAFAGAMKGRRESAAVREALKEL